jgi:hypothetical protein
MTFLWYLTIGFAVWTIKVAIMIVAARLIPKYESASPVWHVLGILTWPLEAIWIAWAFSAYVFRRFSAWRTARRLGTP